jgi:hypothetical protein
MTAPLILAECIEVRRGTTVSHVKQLIARFYVTTAEEVCRIYKHSIECTTLRLMNRQRVRHIAAFEAVNCP